MGALAELVAIDDEVLELQGAYLKARTVSPASATDALHVALATVSRWGMLASWNFRHIVHFQKIPLYNGVNMMNGYQSIAIHVPSEVLPYDDQDL